MFRMYHEEALNRAIEADRWGESVYLAYRRAAESHDSRAMEAFLRETDLDAVRGYYMYLPGITSPPCDLLLEANYFTEESGLYVSHHCAHTPPFVHAHEYIELAYLTEGTVTNTVAGQDVYMKQGDICIVPPYTEHCLTDCRGKLFNVLIRRTTFERDYDDFLDHVTSPLAAFLLKSCWYANRSPCFCLSGEDCPDAAHELLQLLILRGLTHDRRSPLPAFADTSLMNAVLALLSEAAPAQGAPDDLPSRRSVTSDILSYIKKEYRTVTLEDAARVFNYSPSYVSRLIKAETGRNFVTILMKIKVNEACRLLKQTDLSVSDIGHAVGFESTSSFYKTFRSLTGHTPSDYRVSIVKGQNRTEGNQI